MTESKPNQAVVALQGIKAGDVARYVFLPGVVPRIRRFVGEGAGSIASLMALVFAAVRLLPPEHPYLNPVNRGRYGLRHVFGEAWSRLVFTREHIDQVLIFFTLAGGFALLVLQFVYMIASLAISAAHAAPPSTTPFLSMFATPTPANDVALMLLDSVFGVPNMYNSCVSVAPGCGAGYATYTAFPTPFQQGLQALFQYYSFGMLLVAVLVLLYYVLIVVGETATTGTPFGRRFDHIWAPLRLVVAIGLLIPLNYGYNGGKYIVLITARLASGFATNAWINFNQSMLSPFPSNEITPTEPANATYENGEPVYPTIPGSASGNYGIIARPPMPDVTPILEFMTLVQACKVAYETLYPGDGTTNQNGSARTIKPYMVGGSGGTTELTESFDYDLAQTYYNNKDIKIVFGEWNTGAERAKNEVGNVVPYCGEITLPLTSADTTLTGVHDMQMGYFDWVLGLYYDDTDEYKDFALLEGCLWLQPQPDNYDDGSGKCDSSATHFGFTSMTDANDPHDSWKQTQAVAENQTMILKANQAYADMLNDVPTTVQTDMINRGWGGAGLWYNQLSQWNGAYMGAVKGLPTVAKMPRVMEKVSQQKAGHDQNVNAETQYDLNQSAKDAINWAPDEDEQQIAEELANVYNYWNIPKSTAPPQEKDQGNLVIDLIHALFGPSLYDITQNDYVNPLVTLVALGNSILNTAMRNLLISAGSGFLGGALGTVDKPEMKGAADLMSAISGFSMMLVTVAIGIGVTLYYVLPFMPFLYFYFAVGAWVRSIFEAMVGVPLWALAHLKINGQGLPGDSAIAGYFMILEIFIRPILTVFGLLASVTIFSALARTLNNLWPVVTANLTGFDCAHCDTSGVPSELADFKRNSLDQFFFTIMYTITIYMMGTSCFKMIDQVPNGVLRWIGNNVSSFAQMVQEDVGQNLGEHTTTAVSVLQNQVGQSISSAAQGAGAATGLALQGGSPQTNVTGTPPKPLPPFVKAPE